MAHDHDHHSKNAMRNISFAFYLNLIFSLIELIGGIYTNSIAILSDALHDFSDALSLGVAWYLQRYSEKERDENFSYGYKRFSLLGTLFISLILLIGSVFMIKESLYRLFDPQETNAQGMLLLAVLGILINGAAVFRLKKGSTLSEKAIFLHLMEDVLGWIAVLVVSIVMLFIDLPILDPILSLGISCWILYHIFQNLKTTFKILLQSSPEHIDLMEIKREITALEYIISTHDLHIWSLDGEKNILSIHVVVTHDLKLSEIAGIKNNIRTLCEKLEIDHITVEFETEDEDCHYEHIHK